MDSTAFALLIVALAVGSVCKYRRINPALPLIAAGLIFDYFVPDVITELPDPEFILTLVLAPLVLLLHWPVPPWICVGSGAAYSCWRSY